MISRSGALPRSPARLRRARPRAAQRSGPQGRPGRRPRAARGDRDRALAMDIPALIWGVDIGPRADAIPGRPGAGRRGLGSAADLVPDQRGLAGQPRALLSLSPAGDRGRRPAQRARQHDRRPDSHRLGPALRRARARSGARHRPLPDPRGARPALADTPGRRRRSWSRRPISARWPTSPGWPRSRTLGVPADRRRGLGGPLRFPRGASGARASLGADLVLSSTHKMVGSLTQSAMVHLGPEERLDEDVVDRALTLVESTSPSSLLLGSLDAARRLAAISGHDLLDETIAGWRHARLRCARCPGSTCSTTGSPPSGWTATTRCGWPSTSAARARPATRSRASCARATS